MPPSSHRNYTAPSSAWRLQLRRSLGVLGRGAGAAHGDLDPIPADHEPGVVPRARRLPHDHQRGEHGHRVVAHVLPLVDDAAVAEALGDGDLVRNPVVLCVDADGRRESAGNAL